MTQKEAPNGYGLVKHGLGTLWLVREDRGYATWDWGDEPAVHFDAWAEAAKVRRRIQKREAQGDEQILVVPIPKRSRRIKDGRGYQEPFCPGPCNHVSCATVRNQDRNPAYDGPEGVFADYGNQEAT